MKIFYFDVCGTLFSVNTTFHFLFYLFKKENKYFKLFYCYFLTSIFGKILNKLGVISIRALLLKMIKGVDPESINKIAKLYVSEELSKFEIKKTMDIFKKLNEDKDARIILISASIEPIIKALSDNYNVEYYCSKLEIDNSKFTGKLCLDLKGNKSDFIIKNNISENIFYTDNIDDIPCGKFVNRLYFINRKNINLDKIFKKDTLENVREFNV